MMIFQQHSSYRNICVLCWRAAHNAYARDAQAIQKSRSYLQIQGTWRVRKSKSHTKQPPYKLESPGRPRVWDLCTSGLCYSPNCVMLYRNHTASWNEMGWDHDWRRAKNLHGNGRDLLKQYFQHAHGKKHIQTWYIPTTRLHVTCWI